MDLARSVAHRMSRQCTEPYEDLENLAALGLTKAAEKFDPGQGVAFSSFAVPFIQGEILHFLRDQWGVAPKVPRRAIEEFSRVKKAQRELVKLGREVPDQEIAAGLGISSERWQWVAEARSRKPVTSLDESPVNICQDSGSNDPEREWFYEQLELMPELQRCCLVERYFAGLEISEIAKHQKISPQFCALLINQALDQLKLQARIDYGN